MQQGKLFIIAAPSGTGKSTIVKYLMEQDLNMHFSISLTTRSPRGKEKNGVEYFFTSVEDFRTHITNNDFIEYEEVYAGCFYGTLKSQVEKQIAQGQNVIFDVDVNGGINIKNHFGDEALSIFIMPPSIQELRNRLEKRGTDSAEVIDQRIARAEYEISQAPFFDKTVINDDLAIAKSEVLELVKNFLNQQEL
ncbi:MAG: guanylate kinase [Bacteroidaceae bacterium]|nr:guanylate kinase [Bacteroidaceae bacterium]